MALKQHKKAITRIFILMVVMTLLCVGVFSCTTYMEQERKTFVDMSQVELVQLETPAADAPAMKITTSAGTIVAELFPEQAPAYVKQFTELAESGYYDNTYVFSVEDGVYFEAGSPNPSGTGDQRRPVAVPWGFLCADHGAGGQSVGPHHRKNDHLLRDTLCGLQFHRV